MEPFVFTAVLVAAACHAAWNAVIKVGDPLPATTLITTGAAAIALVLLPVTGLPPPAAWPWVIASIVIHLLYFICLTEAYRTGDLGQVYPLARGAAPLMTALATASFIGERVSLAGWAGILVLVCGVVLLSARGGRDLAKVDHRALGFALFTAVTICAYTLVDGIGARIAGDPHAYTLAMFAGNGAAMLIYALARRGPSLWPLMRPHWISGTGGGALQLLSYGIVIWAMTLAPIALVAALRETSVLFGAAIAVMFLKEPVRPARLVAALLILFGLLLLRLG